MRFHRFAAMVGAVFVTFSSVAYASEDEASMKAPDIAQIANGLTGQTTQMTDTLSIVAAVLGVVLAMTGLWKMRNHSNNPNDPSNKMSTAFMMIFSGAMMIALPAVLGSGVASLWQDPDTAMVSQTNKSYFNFK